MKGRVAGLGLDLGTEIARDNANAIIGTQKGLRRYDQETTFLLERLGPRVLP